MSDLSNIPHPLKYTFGYITGFIFLLGIMIYLYLLIVDYLEDPNQHSIEEKVWIYLFLCILVIGFILSYYSIICSIETIKKNPEWKWGFSGVKKIQTKPSFGQSKTIHSSKFIV